LGTVEQNLKLQQSINERVFSSFRSNAQTNQQPQQQPPEEKQVPVDLDTHTPNLKHPKEVELQSEAEQTEFPHIKDPQVEKEVKLSFSKYIKELKALHFLYNELSKLDVSIYEVFKG